MKKNVLILALAALILCFAACQKDDPVIPDNPADPENPDGPTPKAGHFAVSPEHSVIFSLGNVQYNPSTNTWRFAPNQYDMAGEGNLVPIGQYTGWIDLFQWGSGNCPTFFSNDYRDFTEFHDWGENFEGGWRTLDENEMNYLLNGRPRHDTLCVPATVCGIMGFVLLPDDWDGPAVNPMYWNSKFESNVYAEDEWNTMEMAGAIFLPAAGSISDDGLEHFQENGCYWVASEPPTMYSSFMPSFILARTNISRQAARFYLRRSVRLVKDIL